MSRDAKNFALGQPTHLQWGGVVGANSTNMFC